MPGEFHDFLDNSSDQFSVLHLNIRSIKKGFENFKLFLNSKKFTIKNLYISYPIIIAHLKQGVIIKAVAFLYIFINHWIL